MKTSSQFSIIALALVSASLSHAADELTVASNVTANGKAGTETTYLSSDHIRHSKSSGLDMIIDLKSGTITTIDLNKKTYYVVTPQDMEAMRANMAERMKDPRMKQGMAMMQGMSSQMAFSTEVKKTGVVRKVAGYSCDEWLINMGMMSMTECVTSELKFPVEAWAAFTAYGESMRKTMSGFGPNAGATSDYAEKMKAIKGFPVATSSTVDVGVVKSTTTSQISEVRRGAIAASVWEVPAGFTKVESPMMKSLQRGG